MRIRARTLWLVWIAAPLTAQLPFYTDESAVTEAGKFHFEFFNEFDALHFQYSNIRQNTANYKLNYGLAHNLELDVDARYLAILRAVRPRVHGRAFNPARLHASPEAWRRCTPAIRTTKTWEEVISPTFSASRLRTERRFTIL